MDILIWCARNEGYYKSKISFFSFLNENICCEPLIRTVSSEMVLLKFHKMFLWRNVKKYPSNIPVTSSYLEHCLRWYHCADLTRQ